MGDLSLILFMKMSPHFDGKVPNWFHFNCFWRRARVGAYTEIHGFDALRWEDQQRVKEKIGGGGKGDASGGGDSSDGKYKDYCTEYAKSNRSTCRGCESKIDKDAVRISQKDYTSQRAVMYGPQDLWYHINCFAENRDDVGFVAGMDPTKIKGYGSLAKADKEEIIESLGKGDKKADKKRKSELKKEGSAKKAKVEDTAEEKALREQSKLLWSFRDKLQKEVSNEAMKGLLEYNGQELPSGESRLLDAVSDCLAFGALQPCKECKGQFKYSGAGYRCTGNATEWTKCQNITREPQRRAFKIPAEFHDVEFLKKYKYSKRARVFPAATASTSSGPISAATGEAMSMKPLRGMKFFVSKTDKPKSVISKLISDMGGKVVSKIDKQVAAVITTKDEVESESKPVKDAKKSDVHVIDEGFFDDAKKGGAALLITQHSLASWGSDPHDRIGDVVDGPMKSGGKSGAMHKRDEKFFTKSMPDKLKLKVKGGAAVDPDSGLEDTAHVYTERDELHNAVLGMVDLVRGTNSYYKLQLLESDKGNRFWVFRAWGRVGTTIGGNKVESAGSKANAKAKFYELYAEKTGNCWENKKNFVKQPNKFYPLEIDYGADDEEVKKLDVTAGKNSKLPKETQDLIKLIFDVESMKKAMLEFEIDLKKMPLGKLSKKQIESAYKVLTELTELMEKGGTPTQFLDASNRFYTLIPHDFGLKKPPLLDTSDIIKNKIEMLDNLLEIEVAYNMLKAGDEGGQDPIDAHYEKLKTKIGPMDKKGEDYKRLTDYVKNTHASTHNQYDLEVQDIFEVAREGEAKRYKPFKQLHNRKLLWHGSRTTNYAGILSQGLRIAPPEAPVTGYMFGKGVYFADMVSKSANYCRTSKSDPIGVLLLCEVALGNMYELKGSEYVNKLPKGKHSTKGIGRTHPDPSATYKTPDGVEIPIGKGTDSSCGYTSLLYNEFIVYDVAQIEIKYLLKVNFKYKW